MQRVRVGALLAALAAGACPAPHASATEPKSCAAPEYRRLDFRLGSFEVSTGNGTRAGRSRVETALNGCAIVEYWTGAVSGDGRAWYAYDRHAQRWHLWFVNSTGDILRMSGGFEGDSLVLVGDDPTFDGRRVKQRMAWSPLPGGGVLQTWEISSDAGSTWEPFFEGRYARVQ